jgi:hypothetical protein
MPHDNRVLTPVQHVWVRAAFVVALLTGCAGDLAVPVEKQAAVPTRTLPNDRGAAPLAASLRDVMATNALVGRRVRVRGRCLPREGDHLPAQPPRSSGEWQLAADGIAIFVVGPLPSYCAVRGDVVVTIIAVVAEDTLAAIGDLPPSPRRFLVVSEDRE